MGGGEDAIKLANEQAGPQSPPKPTFPYVELPGCLFKNGILIPEDYPEQIPAMCERVSLHLRNPPLMLLGVLQPGD